LSPQSFDSAQTHPEQDRGDRFIAGLQRLIDRPSLLKLAGSLKPQRDLLNSLIVAAYYQAAVLTGFAQPYMYKVYRKYDY
jgi:hypothetical protein